MKFNVFIWNDKTLWTYVATAKAANEQDAAYTVASRFNLKGRFASYIHIDENPKAITSKTHLTVIE